MVSQQHYKFCRNKVPKNLLSRNTIWNSWWSVMWFGIPLDPDHFKQTGLIWIWNNFPVPSLDLERSFSFDGKKTVNFRQFYTELDNVESVKGMVPLPILCISYVIFTLRSLIIRSGSATIVNRRILMYTGSSTRRGAWSNSEVPEGGHHGAHGDRGQYQHGQGHRHQVWHHQTGGELSRPGGEGLQ